MTEISEVYSNLKDFFYEYSSSKENILRYFFSDIKLLIICTFFLAWCIEIFCPSMGIPKDLTRLCYSPIIWLIWGIFLRKPTEWIELDKVRIKIQQLALAIDKRRLSQNHKKEFEEELVLKNLPQITAEDKISSSKFLDRNITRAFQLLRNLCVPYILRFGKKE